MTSVFDTDFASIGFDTLAETLGEDVTVTSVSRDTYDPATSSAALDTEDTDTTGVVSWFTLEEVQGSDGLIERGDVRVLLNQLVVPGDLLTIREVVHHVISVTNACPGVYEAQARR